MAQSSQALEASRQIFLHQAKSNFRRGCMVEENIRRSLEVLQGSFPDFHCPQKGFPQIDPEFGMADGWA